MGIRRRLGTALAASVLLVQTHADNTQPRRLRRHEGIQDLLISQKRMLGGSGDAAADNVCHKSGSFLGVGNVDCLHDNLGTAIFLLAIIIIVSLVFEHAIHAVRRAIQCPQLKKIVNRIFEEVMIMGFISMIIFTLNSSGLIEKLHFAFDGDLSGSERLHFYEFFHYIVFLSMIYFILIVLFLLFVGTVVPKLIWELKNTDADSESENENESNDEDTDNIEDCRSWNRHSQNPNDTINASDDRLSRREFPSIISTRQLHRQAMLRGRANSGMDLVQGSRAYSLLLQRYQREGWCFRFNLKKQWHLWRSFEILAYNICQNRSGYIYKNPSEMERLFGVLPQFHEDGSIKRMTYHQYHILCMRNLLYNISHLHFSAFFVLLIVAVVPVLYPDYDHWIFIGVGALLLFANLLIFFKTLHILRGIVDDRLRIITTQDIQRRLQRLNRSDKPETAVRHRPSLRVVALGVRSIIRMQMSALCHRQLHFHNDRFWFNSPRFLLRLFHFATIGQAFYLVWFSLVEWQTVASTDSGYYLIPIMVLLPFLAMCVVIPMTLPSLVLVMSLTGIFVELSGGDAQSGHKRSQSETKTHIRLMRRSYLRSHYTDTEEVGSADNSTDFRQQTIEPAASPTSVFLRMYDSPTAAAQRTISPRRAFSDRDSLLMKRSASSEQLTCHSDDLREYTRNRRSFDLASFQHSVTNLTPNYRKASLDLRHTMSPRPVVAAHREADIEPARTSTPPISPAFKNYCSKYGGYPDEEMGSIRRE